MLLRKTLREIRKNCGQFISIFLLAAIAIMLFTTFQSSTTGADIAFGLAPGVTRPHHYDIICSHQIFFHVK